MPRDLPAVDTPDRPTQIEGTGKAEALPMIGAGAFLPDKDMR